MELGGNIRLEGFSDLKPADLIIIKKLVGSHVKDICDNHGDFKDILVNLKASDNRSFQMETMLMLDKEYRSNASADNIFFALDKAFKALHQQLKE